MRTLRNHRDKAERSQTARERDPSDRDIAHTPANDNIYAGKLAT